MIVKDNSKVIQEFHTYTATIDDVATHAAEPNPADRQPWIVGLYTHQWEQKGNQRFKSEALFNVNTGLLERSRIFSADATSGPPRQSNDILIVNQYGDYGLLMFENRYGGDLQAGLLDEPIAEIDLDTLTPEYRTQFGYDSNGYRVSEMVHGQNTAKHQCLLAALFANSRQEYRTVYFKHRCLRGCNNL